MQSPFGDVSGLQVSGIVQRGAVETVKLAIQLKCDSGLNSINAMLKVCQTGGFRCCGGYLFKYLIVICCLTKKAGWQVVCQLERRWYTGLRCTNQKRGNFRGIRPFKTGYTETQFIHCPPFQPAWMGSTRGYPASSRGAWVSCFVCDSSRCRERGSDGSDKVFWDYHRH